MKKWITFAIRATCILVLIVAVSDILTLESTRECSTTKACRKCLAHRRIVSRKIMWRMVEDRDVIYPLEGNENVDCQHDWFVRSTKTTFGLGGIGVSDGVGGGPEMRKAIEEYEQRTGRRYADAVQKVFELDRQRYPR